MKPVFLDVAMSPIPTEELLYHASENRTFLIVLLIVLLLFSVVVFNVFVIKKSKNDNEENYVQQTSDGEEADGE